MGAVNTTYTFTPTDTITSTKMNNIIDETVMTSDAVLGGSGGSGGLDISSGKLSISANAINSSRIANNAVTTSAIADGSVIPAKLSTGGPIWTTSYTDIGPATALNPYYLSVTPNRSGNGDTVIQLGSTVGNNSNAYIYRNSGTNGNFTIANNGTGNFTIYNPNGVTYLNGPNGFNVYQDSSNNANFPVPNGTAPLYAARAFINFNGTGTIASRWSGNVSSIVDNGTGNYTINFTNWMPDTNFAVVGSATGLGGGSSTLAGNLLVCGEAWRNSAVVGKTVSGVVIAVGDNNNDDSRDAFNIVVAIFR
jgi:hypothetical protein